MNGRPAAAGSVAALVAAVRGSRKYATVADGVLERLALDALRRQATPRAAERAVRARLHQIYAAYLTPGDLARAEGLVRAIPEQPAPALLAETARAVLARHASSSERIDFQETLYPHLFAAARLGPAPARVVDLGCGLHPLALPWMGLPAATEYRAFDIDLRLCALVDHYLKRAGQPGGAAIWDLLTPPPREASCADLVFCLKTLPLLEQQARGASERLLQSLSTRVWVISFPARSLGGRDKGMRAHYDALMCAQAGRLRLPLQRFDYPTETFYILGPCP